jgi:hypothetical protein
MELLMGVVAVVVVLAMALAHVSAGAVRRQLVGTPRTPISRVTDGVVRISGKITVASDLVLGSVSCR